MRQASGAARQHLGGVCLSTLKPIRLPKAKEIIARLQFHDPRGDYGTHNVNCRERDVSTVTAKPVVQNLRASGLVSNVQREQRMAAEVRFRVILPFAQCVSATIFGGFGLWERSYFLDSANLWHSSVAAHYWPWSYKFAAVLNFPALLAALLLAWPISERWPSLPESAFFAPSLPFVVLLWFRIGGWFDRRWGLMDGPPSPKLPWIMLLMFTLLCAAGASIYITSTTDYLLSGTVIWTTIGLAFAGSTLYRKFRPRAAA